jgi:DNA-binding MarR family transcriptional regulator
MTPKPDPTAAPPLFDQRNCTQRSWHWLEGLLLGPRFEHVQRPDGIWIFQPVLTPGSTGLETAPWVEWAVGTPGSTLGSVLLGLLGLVPDRLSILRWLSVAILLLVVVLGLVYAERRSELLRIAQEQLRRRELQSTDRAAAARFAAIEDRIDQASQQAAQQSVFSGLAVLQTLSNSSDPELARASRYFASLLKEAASEEIELITENIKQSIDSQFDQLQVEVTKRKVLDCLFTSNSLSGSQLVERLTMDFDSVTDALTQLDGQGFVSIALSPESGGFTLDSIVSLTDSGRAAAKDYGAG